MIEAELVVADIISRQKYFANLHGAVGGTGVWKVFWSCEVDGQLLLFMSSACRVVPDIAWLPKANLNY